MKKLIFIFIVLLGVFSCKSDDDNILPEIEFTDLIGTWNWVSTCGGITGACGYPDEDNFYTIEFRDDLTFVKISNGTFREELTYSVIEKDSYNRYKIIFENGDYSSCRVQENALLMNSGLISSYEKITN